VNSAPKLWVNQKLLLYLRKEKMQLETAINRLIKYINRRTEELSLAVTSGGIDSMTKYNYIIGQITALEATKQELSNLLEDKEQHGTVIDIKDKATE
jgi:hypothetical protein